MSTRREITPEIKKKVVRVRDSEGLSLKEMSLRFGISKSKVSEIYREEREGASWR
jgi:transcriptional regulator with XRE-family HTH domain